MLAPAMTRPDTAKSGEHINGLAVIFCLVINIFFNFII